MFVMRKILQLICTLAILCPSDVIAAMENNLMGMPPIDAPSVTIESWRMTFDNYKTMLSREIQLKARFHNPKMDCDCRVEARI